jgi:peptidoglycan L-alanyl-D-glutamate endopeptidase CwlK
MAYSQTSKDRLESCHIDLQTIFYEVDEWQNCSIFCGHRGEDAQNKAYLENKSQVKFPDSKHNSEPSMATDSGPYFVDIRNTDWNDRIAFALYAGRVMQIADRLLREGKITHKLRWGGDWDGDGRNTDQKFHDLPHFELEAV